jgi:hypothetical protein
MPLICWTAAEISTPTELEPAEGLHVIVCFGWSTGILVRPLETGGSLKQRAGLSPIGPNSESQRNETTRPLKCCQLSVQIFDAETASPSWMPNVLDRDEDSNKCASSTHQHEASILSNKRQQPTLQPCICPPPTLRTPPCLSSATKNNSCSGGSKSGHLGPKYNQLPDAFHDLFTGAQPTPVEGTK